MQASRARRRVRRSPRWRGRWWTARPATPGWGGSSPSRTPLGDLLDDKSRELARELRHGIGGLVARGKAEGAVRVGSAEVWAGVWLAVVGHAVEKVAGKDWSA